MKVLNKYIVVEVLKGAFITQIVLLTLFNLFTFTDELKHLGEGPRQRRGYGFPEEQMKISPIT